jgi:cyclic pyranopterin phosphate synthase
MPAEGIAKLEHDEILRFEEVMLLAETAVRLGIEKIRVTGGEPLVRKGIVSLLHKLSGLPGLRSLVLTTNGVLLAEMVEDLKSAGVQRLNISLDSLRNSTFAYITRCGELEKVLAGIQAAEEAGFPIKINMVAMRGVNDDEFVDFAALTMNRPYAVRFIEYMPTMKEESWQSLFIPGEEIMTRIARHYPLRPIDREELSGPSQYFRINGAAGTIGIITPVSRPFCGECNRIRVTASGIGKGCLFGGRDHDLRPLLKTGESAALEEALHEIVRNKPEKHLLSEEGSAGEAIAMSKTGG